MDARTSKGLVRETGTETETQGEKETWTRREEEIFHSDIVVASFWGES